MHIKLNGQLPKNVYYNNSTLTTRLLDINAITSTTTPVYWFPKPEYTLCKTFVWFTNKNCLKTSKESTFTQIRQI